MKRLIFLAFILFLGSGSTLVAQDVRYNFDSKADFTTFKTYKWVEIKDADKANPLVQKQITDTIDAELAKKGLTKTDSDTADLLIGYQTAVGTEKQFTSYNTGWGYGPGWGGGWYGGGGMTTTVGRLRPCGVLDWKFTVLSHNTIRGAAGAAILNAELLKVQGYLD